MSITTSATTCRSRSSCCEKNLRKTEVDQGLQGTAPGEPPAFHGGCQFYFDSIEAFLEVWGPAAAELQADIPRYTDVAPLIQFNEVKMSVRSDRDPTP